MKSEKSHKMFVAGGMAVVLAVGAVAFALTSHPVAQVAQAVAPPPPVAQVPDTAPEAVAPSPAAPTMAAHDGSVATPDVAQAEPAAVAAKAAHVRHPQVAMNPVPAPGRDTAAAPVALPTPEPAAMPAAAPASSDSQITTAVKSDLEVDSLGVGSHIGVTTTDGVVALSGSVASQDAVDHARAVAGMVKDVRSVDTSALLVADL